MDISDKIIRWFVGILFIVFLIILGIVKYLNPAFSLGWILISLGIGVVILVLIFVLYKVMNKSSSNLPKDDEKLPNSITKKEAYQLAINTVKDTPYLDYIEDYVKEDYVEELGEGKKSKVYILHATRGLYEDEPYFVIINMHEPNKNIGVLRNPSPIKLLRAKMLMAINPEKSPNFRTIDNENVITGVKQRITEPIADKDKENKEAKKEDTLNK